MVKRGSNLVRDLTIGQQKGANTLVSSSTATADAPRQRCEEQQGRKTLGKGVMKLGKTKSIGSDCELNQR